MKVIIRTVLTLGIVLISACSYLTGTSQIDDEYYYVEETQIGKIGLCVVNSSIDPYRIYVDGKFVGNVYPGEKRFWVVRNPEKMVRLVGQGLAGASPRRTPMVNLPSHQRWQWVIDTNYLSSENSIQPMERTRCD